MPRTPARFTQADLARALRVVEDRQGWRVRVTAAGDILVERDGPENAREKPPIDERPEIIM